MPSRKKRKEQPAAVSPGRRPAERRAVLIIAPPRCGAGLLCRLLADAPGWATSGLSSLQLEEREPALGAERRGLKSHALRAEDRDAIRVARELQEETAANEVTVDWNPRLSLRIGLLAEALPEARFIVVARRIEPAVSSLITAWRAGMGATGLELPGWWGEPWAFPLVEGWQELIGGPLTQVCLEQWLRIGAAIQADLEALPRDRWAVASFEALLDDPAAEIEAVTKQLGLTWPGTLPEDFAASPGGRAEENLANQLQEISELLEGARPVVDRYRGFLEAARAELPWPEPQLQGGASASPVSMTSSGTPFAFVHSLSLSELLEKARSTVAVSTYKTGHLLLARSKDSRINIEVNPLPRAMGIAVAGNRLAIGAANTIHSYAASAAVPPPAAGSEPADTAYLPRSVITTGEILVHEMSYSPADNQLYFINTRFSCLCALDLVHSFVPIWRPAWVTALAAEDRCHLNGLAVVDERPRYVTALACTDTPQGWRDLKGTAGVVVDITDDRIVAEGLAMPHSPRWHRNQLWVLESGRGTLARVDLSSGRVETVASLPGFTRGLAFIGRYALVGLSQVRETVFSALPITQDSAERWCGVAVVDIETGQLVGALRFNAAVQEIFDVAVIPWAWPTFLNTELLAANSFVIPDAALGQAVSGGAR